MDPCLLSRGLEIICEKERGVWWKHVWCRHTRGERAPSVLVCLPCTPCSFQMVPINTFQCLLHRLYRSETSLTFLDSLTWTMLRYASLNFSKTNTKLLWQGECLISTVLSNMSFVLLMLLLTVFVSPLSEIAAPNLRSLSKACICHKTITKIARLCQKIMFLSDWKLLGR